MSDLTVTENKKSVLRSPYFVMVVLMLGVFMTSLDSFIVSPALPIMVGDLNTSFALVAWSITIFFLLYTAVMPLGGKLSDVFGRKRIYIAGVAIFTIGSLLCSLSWNIYSLIFFRAIQAIGGGLVQPAALSTMNNSAPEDKRGKTMGVLMSMAAVAMVVGPNLGGYFVQHFGWRTVFYINLPIGVLSILLALMFTESYGETKQHIDVIGSGLLVSTLAALLLGLVRLETLPFSDITVFPLIAASVLLAILLVSYEKRTQNPILNIPLLIRGDILSLNLAYMLLSGSLTLIIIYIPSFAQVVLHLNVQDSGTILTPLSVVLMISAVLGGILIDKFGAKPILMISSLATGAAIFGVSLYVSDSLSLAIILALLGLSLGLGLGAFQIIMMSYMPESEKATGSGILGTFENIGGSVGSVIGAFFLADAAKKAITLNQAFSNIFWAGAIIAIIATVLVAYLTIQDYRKANTLKIVSPD
jgi:EmrB/QacA subfamily drug resistance transporter